WTRGDRLGQHHRGTAGPGRGPVRAHHGGGGERLVRAAGAGRPGRGAAAGVPGPGGRGSGGVPRPGGGAAVGQPLPHPGGGRPAGRRRGTGPVVRSRGRVVRRPCRVTRHRLISPWPVPRARPASPAAARSHAGTPPPGPAPRAYPATAPPATAATPPARGSAAARFAGGRGGSRGVRCGAG